VIKLRNVSFLVYDSDLANFFFSWQHFLFSLQARSLTLHLLMVGPRECKWKVLGETDGERFVTPQKAAVFGDFLRTALIKIAVTKSIRRLRILFMRSDILSEQSCLHFQKADSPSQRK
jgi:hypothetical protein